MKNKTLKEMERDIIRNTLIVDPFESFCSHMHTEYMVEKSKWEPNEPVLSKEEYVDTYKDFLKKKFKRRKANERM